MKLQRHIIVTTILAAYALFMTFYFGLDLLKSGQSLRFYLTVAAEIIVIILTFFCPSPPRPYPQQPLSAFLKITAPTTPKS